MKLGVTGFPPLAFRTISMWLGLPVLWALLRWRGVSFTIRQEDYEKIQHHPDFTAIGYIQDADRGSVMVTKGGATHPLQAQGWKHF